MANGLKLSALRRPTTEKPSVAVMPSTERLDGLLDALRPLFTEGVEAYIEWSRLYVSRTRDGVIVWEIVVDSGLSLAFYTQQTRKAHSQGLSNDRLVNAASAYAEAMAECASMVEAATDYIRRS